MPTSRTEKTNLDLYQDHILDMSCLAIFMSPKHMWADFTSKRYEFWREQLVDVPLTSNSLNFSLFCSSMESKRGKVAI